MVRQIKTEPESIVTVKIYIMSTKFYIQNSF